MMLSALVNILGATPSLADVRLVAACLVAFSTFLRYNELAKLKCCDVTFSPRSIYPFVLPLANPINTDKVIVLGSPTCPVAMLECYFSMAALSKQSKLHLFRGIVITKSGECLHLQGSLSYTQLRELFPSKLS